MRAKLQTFRACGVAALVLVTSLCAAPDAAAVSDSCQPELTFAFVTDYPTGHFPTVCEAGDLDGDTFIDLVVTNRESDSAIVFWNDGTGHFPTSTTFATGPSPRGIAIADLDGDLIPDLALSNAETLATTTSIVINNGDRTFQPFFQIPCGQNPRLVAAGDFDMNGTMDLVTTDFNANTISILSNTGGAVFSAPVAIATGAGPGSVKVAHLNMDVWPDLVVSNRVADTVQVFLNDGTGAFVLEHTAPAPGLPRDETVLDVDGDGDLDVAVAFGQDEKSPETWLIRIYANDGQGVITPASFTVLNAVGHGIAQGFIDEDGIADLVVSAIGDRLESVLRGNGDGTYQAPIDICVSGSGTYNAVADLDGNGLDDIVNAGASTDLMMVLLNTTGACGESADLDYNCIVASPDLARLIGSWGACPADPAPCAEDLDGNGVVGASDLASMLGVWGPICD